MAKMTIDGFDELNQLLDRLSAPEEMAIKAVNVATPIVENAMKAQIARVANRKDARGHPYSTGALAASIKATEAKENAYGVYSTNYGIYPKTVAVSLFYTQHLTLFLFLEIKKLL